MHVIFELSINKYQTNKYFFLRLESAWAVHSSLLHSVLEHSNFWT